RFGVHMGKRSTTAHAVARNTDLRTARQRLLETEPAYPGAVAWDVSRSRLRTRDPSSDDPGSDRSRTDAGPSPSERLAPGETRTGQLLGLQHTRVLRAGSAIRDVTIATGCGARIQDDGAGAALGQSRGDSRRRLQPQRRRQSRGTDVVASRDRQHVVLP